MAKPEIALRGTYSGEIAPLQLQDAFDTLKKDKFFDAPANGRPYNDIENGTTTMTTYPDCGVLAIQSVSNSSQNYGVSFIQNEHAVNFIEGVRSASKQRYSNQPFRRLLRHVWLPAAGVPASAGAWYGDVILGSTLPPELFAASAVLSGLATVVKGAANHATDHRRGLEMHTLVHTGWKGRKIFYPDPETQPVERPPVEFLPSEKIQVYNKDTAENQELWDLAWDNDLVLKITTSGIDGDYISVEIAKFFAGVLDKFGEDRAELWQERLPEDLTFFRAGFDTITSLEKSRDVLTSTEKLTGIEDTIKRDAINASIRDVKASMVARTVDVLSVIREKKQAREAHERAVLLEQENQERVATYDSVGLWANIESYPEECRRDIQTLLKGAVALKDGFIDKYGIEKGLEAVYLFDGFTRKAVQLLSEGASFNHIYGGLINKFGEVEAGTEELAPMYAIALPPLEDFQRLYAPENEQGPIGVFGERYPRAFYNIAASMPRLTEQDVANLDLR